MQISVYIPSYNQKDYLIEAIESVLAQTLPPQQIIIVDDCSTDGSREVIAGYVGRYPRLIEAIYHERNTGVAQVRVDALAAATGEYVTYVDGDDRFLPQKLELEAQTLREHPEAAIAFGNFAYTRGDGSRDGRLWVEADDPPPPSGEVFGEVFARQYPRSAIFRSELVPRRCLEAVGGYDPLLVTHEDWDMKIRLSKRYKLAYCAQVLSEFRRHGAGLSNSRRRAMFGSWTRVIEKNLPLLDDLEARERRHIERALMAKYADMAMLVATEEWKRGCRAGALRYGAKAVRIDHRAAAGRLLRKMKRVGKRRRRGREQGDKPERSA